MKKIEEGATMEFRSPLIIELMGKINPKQTPIHKNKESIWNWLELIIKIIMLIIPAITTKWNILILRLNQNSNLKLGP